MQNASSYSGWRITGSDFPGFLPWADASWISLIVRRVIAESVAGFTRRTKLNLSQMFSVPLRGVAYRLELMDSIRLTAPRFGLDTGKDLLVVGLRENGASLATDVELFG